MHGSDICWVGLAHIIKQIKVGFRGYWILQSATYQLPLITPHALHMFFSIMHRNRVKKGKRGVLDWEKCAHTLLFTTFRSPLPLPLWIMREAIVSFIIYIFQRFTFGIHPKKTISWLLGNEKGTCPPHQWSYSHYIKPSKHKNQTHHLDLLAALRKLDYCSTSDKPLKGCYLCYSSFWTLY